VYRAPLLVRPCLERELSVVCRALGFGSRSCASPCFSVEPWGGVHYLGSLVPRGLLESSSEPATSRCQYEVTHLVGATRLVDEISQGTGIRSEPGFRSFGAWRASQASDRWDVSRKPILVTRVSRNPSTCTSWSWTVVELLAAQFTKYHSSLVSWSFPMSGPCP
jgi:hypothetical protein